MIEKKLLSVPEYAKYKGVALFSVQTAIKKGRISFTLNEKGHKRINPELADQEWESNTNPALRNTHLKGELPLKEKCRRVDLDDEEILDFNESRAMKEHYMAKLTKLEYQIQTGAILPLEKVQADWFKLLRIFRDSVFGIPDRVCAQLAAERDPLQINRILTMELSAAFDALCNSM